MISHHRIVQWMNTIRDTKGEKQYRILENFWSSQLNSKIWLVNSVSSHLNMNMRGIIYIFGGWYGILAQILSDKFKYTEIVSVDIDSECEYYGNMLKLPSDNITFVTADMQTWNSYDNNVKLIVNTSTEHVEQEIYNKWLENVPRNVLIALQGNDFYSCNEHIRCCNTLEDFKAANPLDKYLFQGTLDCQTFTRWMTLGYK